MLLERYGQRRSRLPIDWRSPAAEPFFGDPRGLAGRPAPVRELVEHVVVGNCFTALLLAGVSRADARAAVSGDQLGDDAIAAVVESSARQADAFSTTPADQLVPHLNGDIPASAFLRFRLVDLVVHAWDLLRAAGLDEDLDVEVTSALWALVEPHLDEMLAFCLSRGRIRCPRGRS